MYIESELAKRNIPDLLVFRNGERVTAERWKERRAELLDILREHEYGYSPEPPSEVRSKLIGYKNDRACAGKAVEWLVELSFDCEKGEFIFPLYVCVPKLDEKMPVVILNNFRNMVPDIYMPVEEIIDRGVAVAMLCYEDIAADKNDGFTSGISLLWSRERYNWGKIGAWAYASSRALDYIISLGLFDESKLAIAGHSRLGKTALWTAANDERFKYVFANCSGCSGDAITREKKGEHVEFITRTFPHWFCDKYREYADNEANMPFDQHFLLAACAPRKVCIGSAELDEWADPESQFLSCAAASEAYRMLGKPGFVCKDAQPCVGDVFNAGDIGFHMRSGTHYFSRYDWNRYIDFLKRD